MFKIRVNTPPFVEGEFQGNSLTLVHVNEDKSEQDVNKGDNLVYKDCRFNEKKATLACVFWPQPDDRMGKVPLVILRRLGNHAVMVKNLTEISLPVD